MQICGTLEPDPGDLLRSDLQPARQDALRLTDCDTVVSPGRTGVAFAGADNLPMAGFQIGTYGHRIWFPCVRIYRHWGEFVLTDAMPFSALAF